MVRRMLLLLVIASLPAYAGMPEAYKFIQQGQYQAAIDTLADDNTPDGLKVRGNCYKALHEWGKAAECYAQITPQTKDTRLWIADCRLAEGNPGPMQELLKEFPDDPLLRLTAGRRYQWMLRFEDAARELKGVEGSEASQRYILCSLSAMRFDDALQYLPIYVKKYPEGIPTVVSGNLYRWKFKVPEVVKVVEDAQDGTKLLKVALADCYVAVHEWSKCLKLLQTIPEDQRDASWFECLAKCYWGQERNKEAVEALQQAINLESTLARQKTLLFYYRDSGNYTAMLEQTKTLVKLWPQYSDEWLLNQGWAYLDLGKYAEAIPIFEDVIANHGNQRWVVRGAWVSLGECLYKLGQGDKVAGKLKDYYEWSDLKIEYLLMQAQIAFHGPRDIDACLSKLDEIIVVYQSDPLARDARAFKMMVLEGDERWEEAAKIQESMANALPVWSTWSRAEMAQRSADSYFQAKKYKDAVAIYRGILGMDISDDIRADITLQVALCQKEQGYVQSAKAYLTTLIRRFPESSAATKSKDLLRLWKEGL